VADNFSCIEIQLIAKEYKRNIKAVPLHAMEALGGEEV
jgi:hypothetical protein